MQTNLLLISLPIYAIIVIATLLDVNSSCFNRKKILSLVVLAIVTVILNIAVFKVLGIDTYRKLYFAMVQIPVLLGFRIISDYRGIKLVFTLITVVALSTLPVSFAVVARIFGEGSAVLIALALAASFLLTGGVVFLLKSNYLYMLEYGTAPVFWKISIIPALYYIYTYAISSYNFTAPEDLSNFIVHQMPGLIVLMAYYIFLDLFKKTREAEILKSNENLMEKELKMAKEQIQLLKASNKQTAIYRHDLRYHIAYLNACLETNRISAASAYIAQLSEQLEHIKPMFFCEDESVNLILAFYAAKAKDENISVDIKISKVDFTRMQVTDICSLLSNAMDNAIKACKQIEESEEAHIKLHIYEKNKKICFQIANSYQVPLTLEHGIPVTHEKGHGVGTISMIHVVEKYNGVYGFRAEKGIFVFQASL